VEANFEAPTPYALEAEKGSAMLYYPSSISIPPPMSNCEMLAFREMSAEVKSSSYPICLIDAALMVNLRVTSLFDNCFDVAL
jgi:hypothetical protein